jgi:peptidoglycan hydrolase CwlO-like protein
VNTATVLISDLRVVIFLLLSLIALVTGVSVAAYHRSRLWTGVSLNARMEKSERKQSLLDANHASLARDVSEFHREMRETLESVLSEVKKVTQNGAKEHPMEEAIRELREHVTALEMEVAAIPSCPALAAQASHGGTT